MRYKCAILNIPTTALSSQPRHKKNPIWHIRNSNYYSNFICFNICAVQNNYMSSKTNHYQLTPRSSLKKQENNIRVCKFGVSEMNRMAEFKRDASSLMT